MIVTVPDDIEILKYPCYTQAVDRCIRTITEASALVSGIESRDGLIRTRFPSRKNPKTETKQQFLKALDSNFRRQDKGRVGGWEELVMQLPPRGEFHVISFIRTLFLLSKIRKDLHISITFQ